MPKGLGKAAALKFALSNVFGTDVREKTLLFRDTKQGWAHLDMKQRRQARPRVKFPAQASSQHTWENGHRSSPHGENPKPATMSAPTFVSWRTLLKALLS
jgi:hypothetical protein